ncbi:MAG: DUF4956 domain-containing protein [Kiritimatiellae bacterium]|nr:DUF4956 domain-containing protein [Kiritimatiellia bacterium]
MNNAPDYLSMFLGGSQTLTPALIFASMGLSLLLALVSAVIYQFTFRGFTYSRSFIQSMVLGAIVTCMLIMAVGNNLARGLGILGTLTIIRFRTPIRDPRDAVFLFSCLGAGIACGAGAYLVAVAGSLFFAVTAFLLHVLPFASRRDYEGMLRFSMKTGDKEAEAELESILVKYCSSFCVLGVCDAVQGEAAEFSYQVRLLDPSYRKDLVVALKNAGHFASPVLLLQRSTVEL